MPRPVAPRIVRKHKGVQHDRGIPGDARNSGCHKRDDKRWLLEVMEKRRFCATLLRFSDISM